MRTVPVSAEPFTDALAQVTSVVARPEILIEEVPAPSRLAPLAVALTAELDDDEFEASGRFVLLHDPDGVSEWEGSFRAVVFARAELDADMLADPILHDVGWSWVTDALTLRDAHAIQLGGTVTRTAGRSFGSLSDRPADGFVEVRASWTPVEDETTGRPVDSMALHIEAWLDLLSNLAGLTPIPAGVSHVRTSRRKDRNMS
jgi:hypothetical protein